VVGLDFHGDGEVAPGLVDLAVNVRLAAPPGWLATVITESIGRLGSYPDARRARTALAAHHEVDPVMVLPTAGGAEAFTLIARAGLGARPVVVHPQFTEPEAALRAAGVRPDRLVLSPDDGFRLDPDRVPEEADLVLIGNPTNPTGVLHHHEVLRRLTRPGRIVVVDEAFMDAVPGEPETSIAPRMPGLVVLRSLTKTWGLAGLRAGCVIGDPELVARLAAQQPPWSVSTPALAVMAAVCSERGRSETAAAAAAYTLWRTHLVQGLEAVGLPVLGDPATPFVLLRAWPQLRAELRDRGFAVRRGETFPGLGPEWVRIAVREPAVSDALLEVLPGLIVDESHRG
jgi:histidinol-phosphate/aromatic aminotransferase/cobyric acid decarboxylase-like protein